ncbi:DNA primase [Parageobacillus thermoglucosidasius]|uniref:DNA primase n=1 Tax=Parageobacillus thermoglucosidasius TaxID=1426 RepID=UPI000B565BD3|nr:DNA primase [Parageobacillus thermoglucosidasius]MBY6268929.1 DNA primase [Parageobacillus thermoglucosidasius]OUM87102.1 MAG: DNA primase [Parageobacillus thermoglucosidasius]
MGYRIPEETIETIRRTVDIVDVISDYVQLKKQGRNYFGLCPFHGEKTPSFSVSPEKQIFHCFGCGAGGNVFSFLMDIEGISFLEAVKRLAVKANIDLSHLQLDDADKSRTNTGETKMMVEAHELLKKFYHHLLVNTNEGQKALDYLQDRGWTREIIDQFEIGYAPNSWDFAVKLLSGRGFSLELMEKAGLIIRKENGDYFDRFRHRIMFPILNHHGDTVGFSGRLLGEGQPKYLNSPETAIFHKGKILYNFHQARLHIRKHQEVILLEGFADVISAVQAGVAHSVATMGTALTEEHARILRRNVDTVIICYDGDASGIEATFRAAEVLTEAGCHVKIATIPDGLDPDEYIRKHGPDRFRRDIIDAGSSLMAFKMMYFRKGKNLQDENDKIRYIEEVLREISKLPNPIEWDYYLRQLADEFSLSLSALQEQLNRYKGTVKHAHHIDREETPKPLLQKKLLPAFQNAERMLLAHMLQSRDVAMVVQEKIAGNFNLEEHRAIAAYIYAFYEEGNDPDVSLLLSRLPDDLKPLVTELSLLLINDEVSNQELNDYMKHVLNYPKWLMLKEKEQEKMEAERKKDFLTAARIAKEIIEMKKMLSS